MHKKGKQKEGIGRLFELAGPKKKKLTAACLFAVLSSAARLVPFFTIYLILKELVLDFSDISALDSQYIMRLVIITFAAAAVYGISGFIASSFSHRAAFDIIYELRVKITEKLGRVSNGYFTGTTQGAIKKVISDDAEQIEQFVAHHIADIAAAVATPLFTIVYLFVMDWRLALVTLVPIIISIMLLGGSMKKPESARTQKEMHLAKEKMEGTIVEYIHGMPVVKVFNRTLSAFKRFDGDVSGFVGAVKNTAYQFSKPIAAYYAFFGAQLLFLLPAGILLLLTANAYVDFLPIVLLFFLVGGGLKEPLENMMQMLIHSKRITEGVKRIDNILKQPESAENGDIVPKNYSVSFENVSFSYDGKSDALKNVSFDLREGSVTGIAGPSGGGKTTLAQLLLRFYNLEKGSIKIGGTDIKDMAYSKLTEIVSYVFQDTFIFKDTVENNIKMGSGSSRDEVVAAAQNAGVHDVIMALPKGYDTVIGEDNAYLSGGEKQRIAIARVFLKNTPIVILDEATAYADAENEAKIQQAFAKLSKGKTVLIIAHRLKTIENADKILVLKEGELLGDDTHDNLINNCPVYADMAIANARRDKWTIKTEAHYEEV